MEASAALPAPWTCLYRWDEDALHFVAPQQLEPIMITFPPGAVLREQYGKHNHGQRELLRDFPAVTVQLGDHAHRPAGMLKIGQRVRKGPSTLLEIGPAEFVARYDAPLDIYRSHHVYRKFRTAELSGKGVHRQEFHVEIAVFSDDMRLLFLYESPGFIVNRRAREMRQSASSRQSKSPIATAAVSPAPPSSVPPLLSSQYPLVSSEFSHDPSIVAPSPSDPSSWLDEHDPLLTLPSALALDQLSDHTTMSPAPMTTTSVPTPSPGEDADASDMLQSLLDSLPQPLVSIYLSPKQATAGAELVIIGASDFPPGATVCFGGLFFALNEVIPGQRRCLKLNRIPPYADAIVGVDTALLPHNTVTVTVQDGRSTAPCSLSELFTYLDVDQSMKRSRDPDSPDDDSDGSDDERHRKRMRQLGHLDQLIATNTKLERSNLQLLHAFHSTASGQQQEQQQVRRVTEPAKLLEGLPDTHAPAVLGVAAQAAQLAQRRMQRRLMQQSDTTTATATSAATAATATSATSATTPAADAAGPTSLSSPGMDQQQHDEYRKIQDQVAKQQVQFHAALMSPPTSPSAPPAGSFAAQMGAAVTVPQPSAPLPPLPPSQQQEQEQEQKQKQAADAGKHHSEAEASDKELEDPLSARLAQLQLDAPSRRLWQRFLDSTLHSLDSDCATRDAIDEILEQDFAGDLNGHDEHGKTMLHYAVAQRYDHLAAYLISLGADPQRGDAVGVLPLASAPDDGDSIHQLAADIVHLHTMTIPDLRGLRRGSGHAAAAKVGGPAARGDDDTDDGEQQPHQHVNDARPSSQELARLISHGAATATSGYHADARSTGALLAQQLNHSVFDLSQQLKDGNRTGAVNLADLGLDHVPDRVFTATSAFRLLSLSHNKLVRLAPEIGTLSRLEALPLSCNQFMYLPRQIGRLTGLESLMVNENQLVHLVPEIGQLTRLQSLWLQYNRLLPKEIGNLTRLRVLYAQHNILRHVPSQFGQLRSLQRLALDHNKITYLPREIGQLRQLERLYLEYNYLAYLPAEIGQLTSLRILAVEFNKLSYLPSTIGRLSNLQTLTLHFNHIARLPESLGDLAHLRVMSLHHNCLSMLPDSFHKLARLKNIDLAQNKFVRWPMVVANMPHATSIDMTANSLYDIPVAVLKMPALSSLVLASNRIAVVPAEIWLLDRTSVSISLEDNPLLEELPADCEPVPEVRSLVHLSAAVVADTVSPLHRVYPDLPSECSALLACHGRCTLCQRAFFQPYKLYKIVTWFDGDPLPVYYQLCSFACVNDARAGKHHRRKSFRPASMPSIG